MQSYLNFVLSRERATVRMLRVAKSNPLDHVLAKVFSLLDQDSSGSIDSGEA